MQNVNILHVDIQNSALKSDYWFFIDPLERGAAEPHLTFLLLAISNTVTFKEGGCKASPSYPARHLDTHLGSGCNWAVIAL